MPRSEQFDALVIAALTRFHRQNGQPPPVAEIHRVAAQLEQLVAERGVPPPADAGATDGLPEEELAPLVARVLAGTSGALLADAGRQLVKACFYPELRACRDSYREVRRDGSCRRQEIGLVRGRISGTHCVDCPHWVSLAPEPHAHMVAHAWHGDAPAFWQEREVFLPEDFRALRRWLHGAAGRR